ncbi:hypothetical protein O181_014699 [Austropuccinia psidii MF-1]|uniref:Uncharacterized protein n=1 Tax=Austropuccinia psidii MF-1 TaxID=1389203 RepID=A0A9Q3GQ41_9BASI|nr:hypothetical protein [Austropuccinia psidii MF-1]
MEDARTSASSQRPEPFPAGNIRDIPVSLQERIYSSKAAEVGTYAKSWDRYNELISPSEEVHGPRKDREPYEGLDTHVFQRKTPRDKSLVENQSILSEDQKKKFSQGKENTPVKAPQATSKSAKKGQAHPKDQSEGQAKVKGKEKVQVEHALHTELQKSKERKYGHGQIFQYGKSSYGIKKTRRRKE